MVSVLPTLEGYVTEYVQRTDFKLIPSGMLTFDERLEVHRVVVLVYLGAHPMPLQSDFTKVTYLVRPARGTYRGNSLIRNRQPRTTIGP